jgi:drug/metabolite transporter (DMT)-like permease
LSGWSFPPAQGSTSRPALFGVAYTGIFPAFLGYVFYNRAVGEVGASRAGLFIHLMPAFSTILAMLFLGEAPRAYHFSELR